MPNRLLKPEAVVRAERLLEGQVAAWSRVDTRGWSLNEHWTLVLDDGGRAFVKEAAIPPSPEWLRQEAAILGRLQTSFAPALLGFEDGERPLLVLEHLDADAHWPPPWRPRDVEAVLAALSDVAATRLEGLPRTADTGGWRGWAEVQTDPDRFLRLGHTSASWLERSLPSLIAAEATAPLGGESLCHLDVRSDNLCIRGDRAVLVDWNHACIGNGAHDVAFWLPSLALEGGPAPEAVSGPEVDAFAALVAGFFAARAGLRPPEGAPRVRDFQLAQLEVALHWACGVLGLAPPER